MKFLLHLEDDDFLVCDSCANADFNLLPERKLSEEEAYKSFFFYECPNCPGAGFWTHAKSIDEKRQVGKALVRCKALSAVKSDVNHFERQIC